MAHRNISPANSAYSDYNGSSQMQLQVDQLGGHISSLSDSEKQNDARLHAMNLRFDRMDAKLDLIISMVGKMDPQRFAAGNPNHELPGTSQRPFQSHEHQRSSTTPVQVSTQTLESNREESSLGYRAGNLNVANSDSVLKKVEMPDFSGKQPSNWIIEAERFFHIGSYSDVEKLDFVGLCLYGKARKWYNWELWRKGFSDWSEFKRRLILAFSEASENSDIANQEMPSFDGTDPYVWLEKSEIFFRIGKYTDEAKLSLVFLYFEGEARKWFCRRRFPDWTDFKYRLLKKFGSATTDSPSELHLQDESHSSRGDAHESIPLVSEEEESFSQDAPSVPASSIKEAEAFVTSELLVESKLQEAEALDNTGSLVSNIDKAFGLEKEFRQIEARSQLQVVQNSYKMLEETFSKSYILQQRKMSLSPKSWMFKYKSTGRSNGAIQTLEVSRVCHNREKETSKEWPASENKVAAKMFQLLRNTKPATICDQNLWVLLYYEADSTLGIELTTLSQGQIYFSVWHCWRKKKLQNVPEMKLQPHRSYPESFVIILLSSSLWSSFISTEGVYKRMPTCVLIMDGLIWLLATASESNVLKRSARKQRKKKSMFSLMLHILIRQMKKWNKLYKSRMFKYKGGRLDTKLVLQL